MTMTEPASRTSEQGDEMCVGFKKRLYSPYIRGGVWVFGLQTSVLYNSGHRCINNSRLTDFRDFTAYAFFFLLKSLLFCYCRFGLGFQAV